MKRIVSCICILCLMLSFTIPPVSAVATDVAEVAGVTAEGLKYEIDVGEVIITEYTGDATEFVIPSVIEGYPVKSIGKSAFFSCESLTNITIPEGVSSIGKSAFYGCSNLTNITIPDSVTSIG